MSKELDIAQSLSNPRGIHLGDVQARREPVFEYLVPIRPPSGTPFTIPISIVTLPATSNLEVSAVVDNTLFVIPFSFSLPLPSQTYSNHASPPNPPTPPPSLLLVKVPILLHPPTKSHHLHPPQNPSSRSSKASPPKTQLSPHLPP
jgi:hypothetical protein